MFTDPRPQSRRFIDFDDEIAEPIGAAALTGIDERRGPLVLDERRAGDDLAERQRAALVARHRDGSGVPEVRAKLADRRRGTRRDAGAEREVVADELSGYAQVDALDAVARRVAIELAVPPLERRSQRIRRAGAVVHFELVVLAGVAEIDASLEEHAFGRVALVEQRRQALRL